MVAVMPGRLSLLEGNVQLVDRTRDGVALHVARGVDRQEVLNPWFARHVARPPWLELTVPEREALLAPRGGVSPSMLFALDFPPAILDAFWDRFVGRVVDAASDEERRSVIGEFRQLVLDSIADASSIRVEATRTFDLMLSPPRSFSTAYDARSGKFVGLHLDDHENLPFDERWRGFQLMSINLGRAERYFQFVNHDTASLIDLIGGVSALPEDARSAASLVQAIFGGIPDCPVLRMTLKPGQGYIAVTQDLIHDGATNNAGRPDVSCLLGGHFDLIGREP